MIGFVLTLIAGLASYAWRKRTTRWWRVFGGIFLILMPVYLLIAFAVVAAVPGAVSILNSRSPVSDVTYFEAAWILTLFWAQFWSFGALCGYMLHLFVERPPRFRERTTADG
jgi:hypothetical protein